ncbi:MAG: hypothetical protein AVO35_07820 [Candidatus Aegiribacteria sp. MLS_C]|nr:MAG: hypothetical protein AVO35_07820 [Candidatus Aegiribacteria sp. MLS_C]
MPTSLYVHVPFCVSKCPYCSFCSIPYRQDTANDFRKALLKEMEMRLGGVRTCTLYVGGGTPTILPASFWKTFHEELARLAFVSGISESTIETNPGTVSGHELEELRNSGFDRLSIGVQSFNGDILGTLGRIHDAIQSVTCFSEARSAGFRNISVDLIYGIPGQTLEIWKEDLRRTLELGPEHISCYELTLEEGTPMLESVRSGSITMPGEDSCTEMYFLADEILTSAEYAHYEVSNYARGNRYSSLHNCSYWRRSPYIGLGPSAHSFDGIDTRSWNLKDVDEYNRRLLSGRLPLAGSEILTERQTAIERIMLGLRCCGGVDLDALERETGVTIDRDYLRIMLEHGRVVEVDSRIVPTAYGKLFADGDSLNLMAD